MTNMTSNQPAFNATVTKISEVSNVIIHAFMPIPYVTTTYIIELPTRIVVIDFQLLPEAIVNFQRYALSLNKPVDRCFLTHYHFDHFNGAPQWRNICPIYALQETINEMRYIITVPNFQYTQSALNLLSFISHTFPAMVDFYRW